MNLLFAAIMVLSSIVLASSAEIEPEAQCIDAYHVRRPVSLGMVDHEYIGIHLVREPVENNAEPTDEYFVFGLPKGESDRAFFEAELEDRRPEHLQWFGSTCDGLQIAKVMRIATETSRAMQKPHKNWLYYVGRMGLTPIAGKPCGNAAKQLKQLLRPELRR